LHMSATHTHVPPARNARAPRQRNDDSCVIRVS
jgi:hypothetical protein